MVLSSKPSILVLVDWFHPGYRAGGPIRSCVNFSYAMSGKYDIWVLTSDKDFGSDTPYNGIISNKWVDFDIGIKVNYLSENKKTVTNVYKIINQIKPDYIYVNIIYSLTFSIKPIFLKVSKKIKSKFVFCPRGMFNKHGIGTKTLKKKIFIKVMKGIGAFNNSIFHATTEEEEKDIKKYIGQSQKVITAANFPPSKVVPFQTRKKKRDELSLVYIARIHPIKNLHFFLKLLSNFSKKIKLDIFGPIEDTNYWEICKNEIEKNDHKIEYLGELSHDKVGSNLTNYDFMISPTTGENFGHSILESFMHGIPVIIADTTPWRDLQAKKVGWDLSINQEYDFLNAIKSAFHMDGDEYQQYSKNSWNLAKSIIESKEIKAKYYTIFTNG